MPARKKATPRKTVRQPKPQNLAAPTAFNPNMQAMSESSATQQQTPYISPQEAAQRVHEEIVTSIYRSRNQRQRLMRKLDQADPLSPEAETIFSQLASATAEYLSCMNQYRSFLRRETNAG